MEWRRLEGGSFVAARETNRFSCRYAIGTRSALPAPMVITHRPGQQGIGLLAAALLTACGGTQANETPHSTARPSATQSPDYRTPTAAPSPASTGHSIDTQLTCTGPPVKSNRFMLVRPTATTAQLLVLDVSNPLKPVRTCDLNPADGGRFISATRLAFWHGQTLGSADLSSGIVSVTGTLPVSPSAGAYSPDGSAFAYRVVGNQGSSTHLFIGGKDRTLGTVGPIGGRGGPPYGPVAQLEFSPDARYLLDFSLFIPRRPWACATLHSSQLEIGVRQPRSRLVGRGTTN